MSLAINPESSIQNLVGLGGFVGTITGDMAWLLASIVNREGGKVVPITNLSLSSLVAIAADVAQTSTVVAFLTLTAVLCHVAYRLDNAR